MKQYRIYLGLTTGDGLVQIPFESALVNVQTLMKEEGFSGATCYKATGIWDNEKEESMVIEIITGKELFRQDKITEIAGKLKGFYSQNSVLITSQDIEVWEA